LMREAIRSSETSVLTKYIWRNIPENGILHNNISYETCITVIYYYFFKSHIYINY
jgi:hypothetical protein